MAAEEEEPVLGEEKTQIETHQLPRASKRTLSLLPVISIIFFSVAGGPYGTEHMILTAGPLWSVLALSIVPWFWGIPVGLLTTELATAFPEDGGYTTWVRIAFGDFWGFSEGIWSWYSGVCDNALYPVLMVDYFMLGTGIKMSLFLQWVLKAFITSLLTLVNLTGLEVVGMAAVIVNILVMAPFLLLFLGSLDKMHPEHWDDQRNDINVSLLVHTVLWNYNGFDAISTLTSEIQAPEKTIPRALMLSTLLCAANYILPVLVATALDKNYSEYENGHYGVVAGDVLGEGFHAIFFASATISGVGMFLAEVATDTFNLATMADDNLIPRVIGKRIRTSSTPYVAIGCQWAVVMVLISLPFDSILQVDNWLYSAALILEILALFQLRRSHSHVHRPCKIPLEGHWLVLAYLPTLGLCVFAMVIADWLSWVLGLSLVILTSIAWVVFRRFKARRVTL